MSLRYASLSVVLIALGLLSACALRPRYKDMVQPEGSLQQPVEGQTLLMRVVEPATGQPIPGVKVIAGANRTRLAVMSDDQGRIAVPVSQALLEENPLVEVVLPKGVKAYQFQVARSVEAPAPPPPAPPVAGPSDGVNSTRSTAPGSTASPETPPVPPPSTNAFDAGT
jgi:hypothetical protein